MKNPFDGFVPSIANYPAAIRGFWLSLPESNGSKFSASIDALEDRAAELAQAEERIRKAKASLRADCAALAETVFQRATREWTEAEIMNAYANKES